MPAAIQRFSSWLFRLRGPEAGEIVLVQRRIFILPTRSGLTFGLVLLLMLAGSINYSLSLGFILTFLLASLAISAILHTYRNIVGLRITAARTAPVFAGEIARFRLCVQNTSRTDRYSIAFTRDKREVVHFDVPAADSVITAIGVPAERRGILRPGRLTLYTRFPVGLFRAWSYIDLDTHCVVYPRPAPPGLALPPLTAGSAEGSGLALGSDDFAGLREYHAGDSPGRIAWKAAARDQGLLTKQFVGRTSVELKLGLDLLPSDMDFEEKLSRLARWVLDAELAGVAYALDLGRTRIALGTGAGHRERCLETLALFDADPAPRPTPDRATRP